MVFHKRPREFQLRRYLAETMKVDRFDDITLGAEAAALVDITVSFRSRQDDYWNRMCARISFKPPQDFKATDLGQLEIQQNDERRGIGLSLEICAGAKKKIEGLGAIPSDADWIGDAGASECPKSKFGIIWIVLDQQDLAKFVRVRFSRRIVWSE